MGGTCSMGRKYC